MERQVEIKKDVDRENKTEEKFGAKKTYKRPILNALGDLRSLTLSGSPGVLDSDLMSGNPGEV